MGAINEGEMLKPTELSVIAENVNKVKHYFANGHTRDYAWRVKQLNAIARMTAEQEKAIVEALAKDLGKSEVEAWTAEIGFILTDVKHTLKKLKKWMKPRKVSTPIAAQPGKSYLLPEPLGTSLIIGAWNYPFQLVIAPLIAAIAAGNCAVLKPSELAENTSALLAKIVPQYLDSEAIIVVEGGVEETTELLKQEYDHILYTGGEQVGKIVMRAASNFLTPVTLELGGKSPCIVDSNCNLDVTVSRIAWSKWMNAGQTCVAPDYIIVEKAFEQKFIDALKAKIADFYGQDSSQSQDYGRIINSRHLARLQSYLADQNIVFGGEVDTDKLFMSPTIVVNPATDAGAMTDEIFGPILPIVTVDKIEQSIGLVNAKAKPLALYLYTKNKGLEKKILSETSAGNVCVNDGFMFMVNADLPFGGVGNSGMGSYHGQAGFDTFSHLKTVMSRSFMFDLDLRYPPFTSKKFNLLKKFI